MARIDARILQNAADLLDNVGLREFFARDIDTNSEFGKLGHLRLPTFQLPAGLARDPGSDRNDDARLFCEWDKIFGRDHAAFSVIPANESLKLHDFVSPKREDRLIFQAEFIS